MWNEIKRILNYLTESREGKETRRLIYLSLAAGFVLLVINRFAVVKSIKTDYFFIRTALSRLLLLSNISPYSVDINQVLSNYFSTRPMSVTFTNFKFADPIFQLFLFFPFSFIPEPDWASAVYLTINQGFLVWSLEVVYQLFNWRPDWKNRLINIGLAFFSFIGISFIFNPDLTIIQFFLFLMGMKFSLEDKPIPGGFFLALSILAFPMITLPLLLLIAFLITNRQLGSIIWFAISFILLSLAGIIFDNNWPLEMLRNWFLEPISFPFTSYSSALGITSEGAILPAILNSIPIVLFILIALEWLRIPKKKSIQLFWLLSFIIALNPLLIASGHFQPPIIILFTYLFIMYLWIFHSEGDVKLYLLGFLTLVIVVLPAVGRFFPITLRFLNSSAGFNLILIFLTILMLYWVRWWILENPYEGESIEE